MANQELSLLLRERHLQALIFDLDGVVTQTAAVHAMAWKKLFDDFLKNRSKKEHKTYLPFTMEEDYPRYVDGIPRHDGIRNFLSSRGIELPPGRPEDSPGTETLYGLGSLKNNFYLKMLEQGAEVFEDAVSWISAQRAAGFPTAIISASKNCRLVLKVTGLEDLFEVRVDGITAEERNLNGKPAPDIFLEAARELNIEPRKAAVFEDARLGVQAARAGNFGLVVGVNRKDEAESEALLASGADLVIRSFPAPAKETIQHKSSS